MKYDVVKWTIADLIRAYEGRQLDLCPSYQRNPIWSLTRSIHEPLRRGV